MCLKTNAPFRCKFVPTNAVVLFCKRHPVMMQAMHDRLGKYLLDKNWRHTSWRRSELIRAFSALAKLEFDYMDSTLAGGQIAYRFIRIYRKKVLKIDKWFPNYNGTHSTNHQTSS